MTSVYGPLVLHLLVVAFIAVFMVALGVLFGRRSFSKAKTEPYESGIRPVTEAQQRFGVAFYLVAILFLVFDLEATYLYPWAVVYNALGWFGFFEMLIFISILVVGLIYVIRRGALEWD
jgi:NADH-quinone oxidoreductase subunit A